MRRNPHREAGDVQEEWRLGKPLWSADPKTPSDEMRVESMPNGGTSIPRPGMFATVRNRRGVIAAVDPFDGPSGRLHLVHIEYKDDHYPAEEQLLWELEPRTSLLEPTALPDPTNADPMPSDDFDALVRAARWTSGKA